jgi:hypothetical protein
MPSQSEVNEAMVLNVVRRQRSIRLEEVVQRLPQLSWNQIFQSVDSLSRRGEIVLMRRGFDYEIEHSARSAAVRLEEDPCIPETMITMDEGMPNFARRDS